MIDHIAQAQRIAMNTIQSKALIGIGSYSVDFFLTVFFYYPFCCCAVLAAWLFVQIRFIISTGSIGEVPILLAKPQAYMNFSGESVSSVSYFSF